MTIFFDLDDTLLDHRGACAAGATALHAHAQVDCSAGEFVARWEQSLQRQFDRYLAGELSYKQQRLERVRETVASGLSAAEAEQLFGVYLEAYESSWARFPDVAALATLSGHTLGIITNGQGAQQRRKVTTTGLDAWCSLVVISEEVGAAKPDAAIFRRACERADTAPARALHVGDRYDLDAQAARRAGLGGVWLDRGRSFSEGHEAPILHSLRDLPDYVASI